jgi:hypothetical protein
MCVFCQQDSKCKSLITMFYIEYTFLIYFSFLQSSIQSGGNNISFNGSLYDQNHTEYKVNTAYLEIFHFSGNYCMYTIVFINHACPGPTRNDLLRAF